jgi:hypothetical protein
MVFVDRPRRDFGIGRDRAFSVLIPAPSSAIALSL